MAEPYAFNPTFRDTTRDVVTPTLQSTKDLADKFGIKYDYSEILKIFQDAADKGIAVNKEMYDQATQKYYQNIAANSSELLSALRKNNAEAVNTGASRGVAAANELSAMLGMSQQGSDGALDLALQGMTLADKAAADKAHSKCVRHCSHHIKSCNSPAKFSAPGQLPSPRLPRYRCKRAQVRLRLA